MDNLQFLELFDEQRRSGQVLHYRLGVAVEMRAK